MIAFSINKFFDFLFHICNVEKENHVLAQTIYERYIEENNEISRELVRHPFWFRSFLLELYRMGCISYVISNNHIVITEVNFIDYINKEFVNDLYIKGDSIALKDIFDDGFWDFACTYNYNIVLDYSYEGDCFVDDIIEKNSISYRLYNSYVFITDDNKKNIITNEKYFSSSEKIYETITGNKRSDGLVNLNKFCKIKSLIDDAISNNYKTDYLYMLPLHRIFAHMSEFVWCPNKVIRNNVLTFVRGEHESIGNINVLYELWDILSLMDVLKLEEAVDFESIFDKFEWCKDNNGLHEDESDDEDDDFDDDEEDEDSEDDEDIDDRNNVANEHHEYRWKGFDVKTICGRTLAVTSSDDYSVDSYDDDEEDYDSTY